MDTTTGTPIQSATVTRSAMRRSASTTRTGWLVVLGCLLLVVFILSLVLGSVNIPVGDVLTILTGGTPARSTWTTIVLDFRLPKALTALLAGAALGVSGLQMQTLFRNPLADPFVLGVSSGASLGVALVVLGVGTTGAVMLAGLGLTGDLGLTFAAFLGAAVTLMIVVSVAARVQSVMTLLILGLMFGYVTSAIVTLLLYFSITERLKAYMSWTFGSFAAVTWGQMPIFIPVIIASIVIAFLLSKPLNALLLGEGYARSMGMNVRRGRLMIIVSTALLAGTVTAFCGPIGFLGLAVPHLCRALLGTSDHRLLIPSTVLMGGILALVADMIAQMPGNQTVLPLNAVTSLIGAPVVIWVILRRRNLRQTFGG